MKNFDFSSYKYEEEHHFQCPNCGADCYAEIDKWVQDTYCEVCDAHIDLSEGYPEIITRPENSGQSSKRRKK